MQVRESAPEIFLHPGEFHFGSGPEVIRTLLGSCVAVTLWHPQYRIGGMCHILLPSCQSACHSPFDERYACDAIKRFAFELQIKGISPSVCRIKLFGGGNMFAGTRASEMNVGERNIIATRSALAAHGFQILAEHVGGTQPRRLTLNLATGRVRMSLPDGGIFDSRR